MISQPTAHNVIAIHSDKEPAELDPTTSSRNEDIQLWSALTLATLQKQLTGRENDPRFSDARGLVDQIALNFSSTNPIEIADYFQAIAAIAAIDNEESANRLNELEALDPIAA